jgi:hypothetical protein
LIRLFSPMILDCRYPQALSTKGGYIFFLIILYINPLVINCRNSTLDQFHIRLCLAMDWILKSNNEIDNVEDKVY